MTDQIRENMHPESGYAFDINGDKFDVTAWRAAMLVAASGGSTEGLALESTQVAIRALIDLLGTEATQQLVLAAIAASQPRELVNANGNPLGIDLMTRVLDTIDYVHHEIHSGSHFYVQGYVELNDGDTFYMKLVTPDTGKWMHFLYDIKSTGICTTYFDEGASGGMTGGASITPINNNRNSSNTSVLALTGGVTTATSYVLRLENDMWGANGFKENIGGGSGRNDELILKQNTTYLRSFISGADSNIIQFKASWYEHTSKTD